MLIYFVPVQYHVFQKRVWAPMNTCQSLATNGIHGHILYLTHSPISSMQINII